MDAGRPLDIAEAQDLYLFYRGCVMPSINLDSQGPVF